MLSVERELEIAVLVHHYTKVTFVRACMTYEWEVHSTQRKKVFLQQIAH